MWNKWCFAMFVALMTMATSQAKPAINLDKDDKPQRYRAPTGYDFAQLQRGMRELFSQENGQRLQDFYQLEQFEGSENQRILHLESQPQLGWGSLWVNHKATENVFIQVPHRFYDRLTASIANHIWQQSDVKAVMLNTAHRHLGKQQNSNSDLSNAAKSPLLAASYAWIQATPDATIIQLHGFSSAKRRSEQLKAADIILSHGNKQPIQPKQAIFGVQQCLIKHLKLNVLVYPNQANELGGTKNNTVKLLRNLNKQQQFWHIELNETTRELMQKDATKALKLYSCIQEANKA